MASGTYDTPTGRATYIDDIIVEEWDDKSRTYTDHRTGESRPYTEEENAAANSNIESESRLDDLEARLSLLEAIVFAAPPDPETFDDPSVPDWGSLGGVWPNGGLLREGNSVWRNVSGVPLTTPPSGFPGGAGHWQHLFVQAGPQEAPGPEAPEVETPQGYVGSWSKDAEYKVGDVVDKDEQYWKCLVAHGAAYQGTWAPGVAHTVWTNLGPVPQG